jgi:hypothetical protein
MHTCALHVAAFARDRHDLRDIDIPDSYQIAVVSDVSLAQQSQSIVIAGQKTSRHQPIFYQPIFQ